MSNGADAADLLERSPEEASRLLALQFLEAARRARARLADAVDAEALHDYRVALRRLRSTLRTFRDVLGDAVPRKLERRLRGLASSTNGMRDAEVAREWLTARLEEARGAERRAARWLLSIVVESESAERQKSLAAVEGRHAELDRGLRRRLQSLRIEVDLESAGRTPTLRDWLKEAVRRLAAELAAELAQVSGFADAVRIHRARIAAKRLRYLLEPLRQSLPPVEPLAAELRALQDSLGAMHDAHVLVERLAGLLAEAAAARVRRRVALAEEHGSAAPEVKAAARASAPPGVLLLVGRLREEQREQFAVVEGGWLGGAAGPFFAAVETLAANLAAENA